MGGQIIFENMTQTGNFLTISSKESGSRGPGFELPPERALGLSHRSTGVLESWSNGKNLSEHFRVFKMYCTH